MAGNAPQIPGCRDLSLIGERVARSLFAATSDRVGRPVTVTLYPPLSEGRTRADFDRAAATAQRLGVHPSVITIHDWGHTDDDRPWIVTDPQPAEAVDTLLKLDGPLEVERALQVGVLLAGALETAHRAGIVHGDLSPTRLVFGAQGEPLLAETGLAPFAVFPGLSALNNPVRYHAPPEVLERDEITPATDVYSLATTVYALLAGRAPQEKPAEITDSNASLLLRILQMAVPPIGRPGLPPGLMDALRGPLSAVPDKRPQQAIEMAWLLQDVQRRSGLAVTEPVVLDLDDIPARPPAARARSSSWAGVGSPARPPAAAPAPEVFPAPTIFPFAPGGGGLGAPAVRPATGNGDGAGHGNGAGPIWPSVPGVAAAEPEVDDEPDGAWDGEPDDEHDGGLPRHLAASAEEAPPTLWPTRLPTADDPPVELPAWARPPEPEPPLPRRDRPVSWDAPPTTPAPVAPPAFAPLPEPEPAPESEHEPEGTAPLPRPPELDVLPSWYTDPLPNGQRPAPTAEPGADLTWPPLPVVEAPVSSSDRPLPGSGDELRSLFGQVVGDPEPPAPVPAPPSPPVPSAPWDRDVDPLGPADTRPPLDLSKLHAFEPPPPVAAYAPAPTTGRSGRPAEGGAYRSPASAAEAPVRATRATTTLGRPPERRDGGPSPAAEAPLRNPMAAGPAALPVIVLVVVVAILVLGIGWLVVAGDDAAPSASERQDASQADDGGAPAGVVAEAAAGGVRVSWDGPSDASYVVTVLSATAPPQVLAPTVGTSTVVPAAPPGPAGDLRCFTVATVPEAGRTAAVSAPACLPGASAATMQQPPAPAPG
jgi:serine/threonine protein kinase